MKLSTLLTIQAVVSILFGLAFVFVPVQTVSSYGIASVEPPLRYMSQLFGATLVFAGLVAWAARSAAPSELRAGIVRAFMVGDAIGFVLSLVAQTQGVVNALGWSTVVLYLLLTLAFGWFALGRATGETQARMAG